MSEKRRKFVVGNKEKSIFALPKQRNTACGPVSNAKGSVVQLVRMPPCHGGGRGFEPRPVRKKSPNGDFFISHTFYSAKRKIHFFSGVFPITESSVPPTFPSQNKLLRSSASANMRDFWGQNDWATTEFSWNSYSDQITKISADGRFDIAQSIDNRHLHLF